MQKKVTDKCDKMWKHSSLPWDSKPVSCQWRVVCGDISPKEACPIAKYNILFSFKLLSAEQSFNIAEIISWFKEIMQFYTQ